MATNVVGDKLKAPKVTKADLKEFANSEEPAPVLADFQPDRDAVAPIANKPSIYNSAAYAAALSPEGTGGQQIIDNFESAVAEGSEEGQSVIANTLVSDHRQRVHDDSVKSMGDILADPSIDDNTKIAAARAVNDEKSPLYDTANMLSAKAVATPEGPRTTEAQNTQRTTLAQDIVKMNAEKHKVQMIYNQQMALTDDSASQSMTDLVMGMIPGLRQTTVSQVRNDLTGEGASAFLRTFIQGVGTSQRSMRDYVKNVPTDQLVDMAQRTVDVINSHPGILISTPNEENQRSMLQSILSEQNYTNEDELKDNIGSWLDLVFTGGGLALKGVRGVSKFGAALKAGAKDKKLADAFEEDFNREFNTGKSAPETSVEAPGAKPEAPLPQPYSPTNKNSMGQFLRSREKLVYDSSNGIPFRNMPDENLLSSSIRDGIRSQVQPVSLYNNFKDTNVELARAAYETVAIDGSEKAAKAYTGTSRVDALASPVLPEVVHLDGSVANKVPVPNAVEQTRAALNEVVDDVIKHDGLTQYQQGEKAAARSYKANQFRSAVGLTPRGEMFQVNPDLTKFNYTPQGFNLRGVYGSGEAGFIDAQSAVDTAKFALRDTGIDESAIGLLRREGDKYVPARLEDEVGKQGDYLVSVEHNYRVNDADVTAANGWEPLKVKMNFFDRWHATDGKQGTLAGTLLDKASMLDPTVVQSAVIATDKATRIESALLGQIQDFAKTFKAASKDSQARMTNEILEANATGRDYDFVRLSASGVTPQEMEALRKFRTYWDGHWHLKNRYFAKQLDNAGYEEFVHTGTNTSMPVRRVQRGEFKSGANVYDPVTDTIVHIKKSDLDDLYKNGGGIAKLRQKQVLPSGDVAEYVKHTPSAQDGFLRRFNNNSQVLNYRPGYYGVDYKKPFHIIEKVVDKNGKELYSHSIATAEDTPKAKLIADKMNANQPPLADGSPRYYYRKAKELDDDASFEREFDVHSAQGMSSFRRRGKLLEDSDTPASSLRSDHVRSPVETMVRQSRSLSNKVAMSDVISTMKNRAVAQWGHFLPKNQFGERVIPRDIREIKYRGGINQSQSDVADARTSFGYINYLENGYVNLLDDGMKATLNSVADLMGELSLGRGERLLRNAAEHSLNNGLRSASYYAYLGFSPLRQLIIQSHQAVLLSALNPKWVASGRGFAQPAYLALRTMGMRTNHPVVEGIAKTAWGGTKEAEEVFAQFQRSGLTSAIDHQNLVSGAVNDLAQNMIAASRGSGALHNVKMGMHAIGTLSRRAGFDAGEFYNSSTSWLAHRDLAVQKGLNVLDDEVIDKVAGQSRNWTGNMNNAGDMDTNRNALSLIFQYTQNSQKMILNMFTNRGISVEQKLKLAALSTAMFGTGSSIFYESHLSSIHDPNARSIVRDGMEGWSLNKMFSLASGQKSDIDFSGMSPYNAYGTMTLIHGIFTQDIGKIIAGSPSLSMFFGGNPRVTNAVKQFARYTHLIDDFEKPTTFKQVAEGFLGISSGYSSYARSKYIFEAGKKLNSYGKLTDEDANWMTGLAMLAGFGTNEEAAKMWMTMDMSKAKKTMESDVAEYHKQLLIHYKDETATGDSLELTQNMLNEFHRVYGDNQEAQRLFNKLLQQDIDQGEAGLYNAAMRNCDLYNRGDCRTLIDAAPFTNEQDRQSLKDILDYGDNYNEKDYDEKDK